MKLVNISWRKATSLCELLAKKVKKYNPDILIGVSRGGLVPVRLLSDILHNKDIAVMKIEFYKSVGKTKNLPEITQPLTVNIKGKKVLLVDDVSDTGKSLVVAKNHIKKKGAKEIRIATLHFKSHSILKPDYYIEETDKWLVYPWEIHETKEAMKSI